MAVAVSHDELVVEREPITEANRGSALDGADITEAVHEVVLEREEAVVTKETVPVERIRLETDVVTETEQVSGTVREEQVELDAPEGTLAGDGRV